MPFCPQCGYEYRPGVTTCPDCGELLSAEPPEEPQPTDAGWPPADVPEEDEAALEGLSTEPLVLVFETSDEAMATIVKDALQDAGLPVAEEFDRAPRSNGLSLGVIEGPFLHLLVPESRADEARQLVADFMAAFQRGDFALEEEAESEEEALEPDADFKDTDELR